MTDHKMTSFFSKINKIFTQLRSCEFHVNLSNGHRFRRQNFFDGFCEVLVDLISEKCSILHLLNFTVFRLDDDSP